MSEDVGEFGILLHRYRQSAGLSQEELAERSGLSARALSSLECGRTRRPHPHSVRRLAEALELGGETRASFIAAAGRRLAQAATATAAPTYVSPPTGAVVVVPRQLPTPVRHFTGRQAELGALTDLLGEAASGAAVVISAIDGMAGVGKTALALHWAHRIADRFPDGQLYLNLRGFDPSNEPVPAHAAVRIFLDGLGVPAERVPHAPEAQAALYRSMLAGKRMLVVIDNARHEQQVRPLLPGSPGCLVVITSRNQLTGLAAVDGARALYLDVLTDTEARDLLERRLGGSRVGAETQAVVRIITRCAGLPLALNVAAARAAACPQVPLRVLAGEMSQPGGRLGLVAGDALSDLSAVFSWSYQALGRPAARMFRLLGVHPGPDISVAAAASLAAVGRDQARHALGELTAAHLLIEPAPGRYSLHDLLRAYAAEHTGTDGDDRTQAIHRILDHYLHTARAATLVLFPARDPVALPSPQPGTVPEDVPDDQHALAWFDTERPALLAAAALAARARFDSHAWQIPSALAAYLERRGHWDDYAATQTTALTAAEHADDLAGQASAHCLLGRASGRIGGYPDAHSHLRRALDLYRKLDDRTGQAHTHHSLGWILGQQGRYAEALHHAHQALTWYRAAGHRTGQARALNTVGWYGSLLGMHQEALTYCQQALELHRELGNHDGEADAWDSLGHAHHHLGHPADAIACYRRALGLFRKLGDRHQQAATLGCLGDTYRAAGDGATARDTWTQALTILNDLHLPDADNIRGRLASLEVAPDALDPSTDVLLER